MSNNPHLIVIDDEPQSASIIAYYAQTIGFDAEVTDNAKKFFLEWSDNTYEVIVIDLCMPEMDGIEVIQELAKVKCAAAIILVSGFGSDMLECSGKLAKAYNVNLQGVFGKPFSPDEILPLLQQIYKEKYGVKCEEES